MKGKFIEGNNPLALFVSVMVLIVSIIVTVIIATMLKERILTLPFSFIDVGLALGIGYLLTKGKFLADEKGVEFKVGFLKYYYSYRQIVSVKTETILENGRYGKIPYVQIALSLKNGEIMTFCDQIPRNEADTLESIKDYQDEHKFTELCEYIKNRIS
ncbi:MAG: hypothetical protein K2K91_07815 [Ruminococcus sp.]|nr:hypothetical protein [Ruminococcus sp.]MDE7098183.1 hypothetical protein [Ruminococcus sp.]